MHCCDRSPGPFVAVNCAAIPSELFEAELFGIGQKVATDVVVRTGQIEMAHHGTLFLDELGSFPIALQPKILRAIEEKMVTRVGEHRSIPVDFRLITANNEDPRT
ncbi:sigma-54 factor interaction domain-containing protein [bacterium]|nr:sigma-54 factor interaction domain-containing protein [bacterium]MCI0602613.1 sigma-54 factor interaction domain-containing protein [bacterium]